MESYVLAFGASNSKSSINKQLAYWAVDQLGASSKKIDLNDYEMPIYSVDRESFDGIPDAAKRFKSEIRKSQGILISLAEHNGAYTAAFKNLYDWTSRISKNMWEDKPLFLLSTSPGGRGAKTVLEIAHAKFSRGYPSKILTFSLPEFNKNFDAQHGIVNDDLAGEFEQALKAFQEEIATWATR